MKDDRRRTGRKQGIGPLPIADSSKKHRRLAYGPDPLLEPVQARLIGIEQQQLFWSELGEASREFRADRSCRACHEDGFSGEVTLCFGCVEAHRLASEELLDADRTEGRPGRLEIG